MYKVWDRDKEKADTFAPHAFKKEVELLDWTAPKIILSQEAHDVMWHIVNISEEEVGWLGLVKRDGATFFIEKVLLFEQEVSSITCEITPDGLANVAMELINSNPDDPDILNRLRFWGHSHVNMSTIASQQDDDQMETFASSGSEFFIRGILNKRGRMEFSVFLYDRGLQVNDVPWEVYTPVNLTLAETIKAELDAKVSALPNDNRRKWWNRHKQRFEYYPSDLIEEDQNDLFLDTEADISDDVLNDPDDAFKEASPDWFYYNGRWIYHGH